METSGLEKVRLFACQYLGKLTAWFNQLPSSLMYALLFYVNFLSSRLTWQQEVQFSWARAAGNPAWLSESFLLRDNAEFSFLSQYILQFFLNRHSFEVVNICGSAICLTVLALGLSRITAELQLSNACMVFLLQVLFFPAQAIFGREEMLSSFGQVSIAYCVCLFALHSMLLRSPLGFTALSAVTTYLDFTLGFSLYLLGAVYFALRRKENGTLLLYVFYPALISPLIFAILAHLLRLQGSGSSFLLRFILPLELPFALEHSASRLNAASWCWAPLPACLLLSFAAEASATRRINRICALTLLLLLAGLYLGYFSSSLEIVTQLSARLGSLAKLIVLLTFVVFFRQQMRDTHHVHLFDASLLFASLPFFVAASLQTMERWAPTREQLAIEELANFARENTPADSLFLNLQGFEFPSSDFIRRSERDCYFDPHYLPAATSWAEFQYRSEMQKRLAREPAELQQFAEPLGIDYLLSRTPLELPFLVRVYRNDRFVLYKLR